MEILLHSRVKLRSSWLSNTNQPAMSTAASARKRRNVTLFPWWLINVGHLTHHLSTPRTLDSTFETFGEGLAADDECCCFTGAVNGRRCLTCGCTLCVLVWMVLSAMRARAILR